MAAVALVLGRAAAAAEALTPEDMIAVSLTVNGRHHRLLVSRAGRCST